MPFKPGQSGNPKGKPKGSGRNQQCKDWADKYGIDFLIKIAEGKVNDIDGFGRPCKANLGRRMDAAKYIIDQGLGKAPQTQKLEVGGKDGGTIHVTLKLPEKQKL